MKLNPIEKNVPVPTNKRASLYAFHDLGVGDSRPYKVAGVEKVKLQRAASLFAQRRGWKFLTRTVDGGVRVWRIE